MAARYAKWMDGAEEALGDGEQPKEARIPKAPKKEHSPDAHNVLIDW